MKRSYLPMEVRIGPQLIVKIVENVLTIQQILQESMVSVYAEQYHLQFFSCADNRMDGTSCGSVPNSKND